ncbi:hypothetical protein TGRH88_059690 [Toxoplasma gondii]|uniref:Uncharacterized protein n=1 Tax=Toxoplasma gondii TaxID=5811 RepID=A0A7J6JVG3_TOXGO|nr:hypothetical protein TGRH88_059690 [Toxoplasma gondii]
MSRLRVQFRTPSSQIPFFGLKARTETGQFIARAYDRAHSATLARPSTRHNLPCLQPVEEGEAANAAAAFYSRPGDDGSTVRR